MGVANQYTLTDSTLIDSYGRQFPYLRLSLTEACNYRCTYCLPDGYHAGARSKFLALDEIERLVRAFAALARIIHEGAR